MLHLRMDVLDLDGRLVDQDADRQGKTAQRHDVDRVAGEVQHDDRAQERQRDIEHHDDDGPQIAQEQEHHQSGQPRAQGPLDTDALDRAIHDRRLIELVRDLHVIRQAPPGIGPCSALTAFTTESVEAEACFTTGK